MELVTNAPLLNAIKNSTAWRTYDRESMAMPSHAYLFVTEDRVVGEQLLLLAILRAYCADVCLTCPECKKVLSRNKPDVVEPNPNGELLSVEAAQGVVEDAMLGSFEGGKKIYVLRAMHLQRERVQNVLLKTLEEPNENVMFLLLAEREKGILPTVLSRVKTLKLAPFSQEEAVNVLRAEGIGNAEVIAKASMGNMTLAKALGSDEGYFALVDEVVDLLAELKNSASVPQYLYRPIFAKDNIAKTLDVLEIAVKDVTYVKCGVGDNVVYRDKLSVYRQIAPRMPMRSLPMILDLINEAKLKLQSYCAATNVADSLLLGILEVINLCVRS